MEFQITITDKLRNFSDYVDVKQTQENGVVVGDYKMSLTDIIRALSNAATQGVKHETPFIPRNCLKLITNVTGYEVFIELPKRKWQITYNNQQIMLGFPRLILKYYISQNSIQNLKIVAVKEHGAIIGDTEIFHFPYSNVHHGSGDVCMGTNVFPKLDNLTQLEKMHILFFSAPFGNDYGSMALGKSLEGLFKDFQDKEFDDELLIPVGHTFSKYFGLID